MKWIILLRGVNVGGKGRLPMKEFRDALMKHSICKQVESYIQSGNLVLDSAEGRDDLEESIAQLVSSNFGFNPKVLAIRESEYRTILAQNPFPQAHEHPKSGHVFFLGKPVDASNVAGLENKRAESESFQLTSQAFYLWAPDGIGRSKLASGVEKVLGVPVTGRNWRTASKLLEMLG